MVYGHTWDEPVLKLDMREHKGEMHMDRRFCKACVYGRFSDTTFCWCNFLEYTGMMRPHIGAWCLGWKQKRGRGIHLLEDKYIEQTKWWEEHYMEATKTFTPADVLPIDEVITAKTGKRGDRYTKEEKSRVVEVAENYGDRFAAEYFALTPNTVRVWMREPDEADEDPGYERMVPPVEEAVKETAPKATPKAAPKTELDLDGFMVYLSKRREALLDELATIENTMTILEEYWKGE